MGANTCSHVLLLYLRPMEQKEFFNLIKKYKQGKCSDPEKQLLFRFCEELQVGDITQLWSLLEEEEEKRVVFQRIHKTLRTNKPPKVSWKKIRSVVAIFIGLVAAGYFYIQYIQPQEIIFIPENAITLELRDGTIEIIREEGAAKVLDQLGNVVGKQKGNQLVYSKTDVAKELAYNTLTVPYGKRFELQLSDGTKAHLNAGSSLKYPVQFLQGIPRKVFVSGEAYLDVAKDTKHPFIVNAQNLNVRVLGTQFNVHAYPEDNVSEIVLVEGSVGLYESEEEYDKSTSKVLMPGYKASFNRVNRSFTTDKVLPNVYTSWRKGELVFRNMSFDNILKKLERHYAITIVNNNTELAHTVFNASFGNEPLNVILESLQENYGITFEITQNTITINSQKRNSL